MLPDDIITEAIRREMNAAVTALESKVKAYAPREAGAAVLAVAHLGVTAALLTAIQSSDSQMESLLHRFQQALSEEGFHTEAHMLEELIKGG